MNYDDEDWKGEIEELFRSINFICVTDSNQSCSTHIHISPGLGIEWELENLKRLCRAIIWFELAFEVLVPRGRRQNEYAKSNRYDNPRLQGKMTTECMALINACDSNPAIATLMNNDGDRYMGWNFLNLYYGGKHSVEIPQGPWRHRAHGVLVFD